MNQMDVRPAGPGDADAIDQVLTESAEAAYAEILAEEHLQRRFVETDTDALEDWLEQTRSDDDVVYLVSQVDRTVAGFAQFVCGTHAPDRLDAGIAFLKSLYVRPAHWRDGHGENLLSAGLSRLPGSADRVEVAVFEENEVGQRFYEKQGFERTGAGGFEIDETTYDTERYHKQR